MSTLSPFLTPSQAAYALSIDQQTLDVLVRNGIIPHTYVHGQHGDEIRFNAYLISEWLQTRPQINLESNKYLDSLRSYYKSTFSDTIQSLKALNGQFAEKRKAKGYNLAKVSSKKYGFLYYVRYIEKGKLIHSRWNTHTNNREAAEQFAVENRERILHDYYAKKQLYSTDQKMFSILSNYYKEGSAYFDEAQKRGRNVNPRARAASHRWICKVFIPFLRKNGIFDFDGITPPLLAKLQTHELGSGSKAQTVNQHFSGVSTIFDHMVMNGIISENVFDKITRLKVVDCKPRGCYELDKLNGVFNRKWREELEYFLDMLIYTTDMRNSEIERVQTKDIIKIKDCYFIDIPASKSENGIRIVPLHPFAYEKIMAYIRKTGAREDDCLFTVKHSRVYLSAKRVLCEKLHTKLGIRLDEVDAYIKKENITFYSGRHFWKTLMNANGLGDVEEYFMGHKVSSDVAKRYNRKDKVGQALLLKKAREVYRILDKWVFKQ